MISLLKMFNTAYNWSSNQMYVKLLPHIMGEKREIQLNGSWKLKTELANRLKLLWRHSKIQYLCLNFHVIASFNIEVKNKNLWSLWILTI